MLCPKGRRRRRRRGAKNAKISRLLCPLACQTSRLKNGAAVKQSRNCLKPNAPTDREMNVSETEQPGFYENHIIREFRSRMVLSCSLLPHIAFNSTCELSQLLLFPSKSCCIHKIFQESEPFCHFQPPIYHPLACVALLASKNKCSAAIEKKSYLRPLRLLTVSQLKLAPCVRAAKIQKFMGLQAGTTTRAKPECVAFWEGGVI